MRVTKGPRMKLKPLPSADRLRELLDYAPDTGTLRWKMTNSNRAPAGSIAGEAPSGHGYRQIGIDGDRYRTHRVIWKLMTGRDPVAEIDHVDGDRSNNRWANLREASHSENGCNKPPPRSNTSGFKGVYFDRFAGRWKAQIKFAGRRRHLGRFDTPEEAHAAYRSAAARLHGAFARTGA